MHEIPAELRHGPFTNRQADDVEAARLAMPTDARLTGITRLQVAGLADGPNRPIRFVIARDHHIALDGVFLHRTEQMPPVDDVGVTPMAAFVAYCRRARVIDAIKVGDWLLQRELMTVAQLEAFAMAQLWRDGAPEAVWVAEHLVADSRSLKESETRGVLTFAGLPRPESNVELERPHGRTGIGDLLYRDLGLVIEYEGAQHQLDRGQYAHDIDRYADLRRTGLEYVQVTQEKLVRPRSLVREVHQAMLARGYTGPAPEFGERWRTLFLPLTMVLGPRVTRSRAS